MRRWNFRRLFDWLRTKLKEFLGKLSLSPSVEQHSESSRSGESSPVKPGNYPAGQDDDSSSRTAEQAPADVGTESVSAEMPGICYPEEDSMLSNLPWVKLVEDCIDLFSELDRHLPYVSESDRKLVLHTLARLTEILQRSGVSLISSDTEFDPRRHKCENFLGEDPRGARITKVLRHGFAVGRRVFLKAIVEIDCKESPPATS